MTSCKVNGRVGAKSVRCTCVPTEIRASRVSGGCCGGSAVVSESRCVFRMNLLHLLPPAVARIRPAKTVLVSTEELLILGFRQSQAPSDQITMSSCRGTFLFFMPWNLCIFLSSGSAITAYLRAALWLWYRAPRMLSQGYGHGQT